MSTSSIRFLSASLALAALAAGLGAAQPSRTENAARERTPAPREKPASAAPRVKPGLAPQVLQRGLPRSFDRVLHDRDESGAEWARGAGWKARFDAAGASFVPFLGSGAPRNFPLGLHLSGLSVDGTALALEDGSAAVRDGERITIEHGTLSERYELALHGLEQSFVVRELPLRGELVLQMGFETELGAQLDAQGVLFSNALGGARYGRATAIDALGRKVDAPLELDADAIRIRVPQEFVAEAVLPLTIDPSIYTWTNVGGVKDDTNPDLAYLASSDQHEVVWEEAYSATDHDVYAAAWDSQGVFILNSIVAIDATTSFWALPRIASCAHDETFLVVAQRGQPAGLARTIVGRILASPSNALGPVFTISGSDAGDKLNPDVCGDGRPGAGLDFCVVWERAFNAIDHDIHAQFVTPVQGTLVFPSTVWVDNSGGTLDQHPALPKSCGSSGQIPIVWEREHGPSDHDIRGARYGLSGTQYAASTTLVASLADTRFPSASAGLDVNDHWLLAYQVDNIDWDVLASNVSGMTLLDTVNVSALEGDIGSNSWTEHQVHVDAETDGDNFELAYSESFGYTLSDLDTYFATLGEVGGKLHLGTGHVPGGVSQQMEEYPRLCASRSGGGNEGDFMAVWQNTGDPANLGDVVAALLEDQPVSFFCYPGADAGSCPCGNQPIGNVNGCNNSAHTGGATLDATGSPSLASDSLHFHAAGERNNATTVLLSGNALTDVAFGQGRRCVGGTLKRLYVQSAVNGALALPAVGSASIHARSAQLGDTLLSGATRYYMAYYRDPVVPSGCAASATFNSTPAGAVTWRP